MKDDNFLRSVARYYGENSPGRPAAEDVVFILPNKRSAMFLKKYVRETVKGVAIMPRFMTLRAFASLLSPDVEADARELLFILYDAYRDAMARRGSGQAAREFDSFVFWGDMMLSDFEDIDMALVYAEELFKNLRDVKEIQADYLDEDQKETVRRIWGESRLTAEVDSFWLHTSGCDDAESLSGKFVYLWEVLADVYRGFRAALRQRRMASPAGQFRAALEALRNADVVPIAGHTSSTHYVFVGFNDLTTVEALIFERLRRMAVASFFWDTAPVSLVPPDQSLPTPLKRLMSLVKSFPMPDDYTVPLEEGQLPDITVTAVPSDTGQAKAIHDVLDRWMPHIDSHDPLNTAVILPDQNLLLPAMLSVPDEIEAINISMGLAYRTTTFASLLSSIISMQLRSRELHGELHYFYEDVDAVLAHPHIQQIARDDAERLSALVNERRLYNVPVSILNDETPALSAIFNPVKSLTDVKAVAGYLITLFDWLSERLAERGARADSFEIEVMRYFRAEVEALAELALRYGVTMSERTFLHLFERVFNTRGITVNGTPLRGLQMLGVLETRALDFDNIIVLSMNERIFPRRQYSKTMIPGKLRRGFGLPDFESLEWTYAYSFYRLLSRAKRVALFYDSRPEGRGNGEMSRYIAQMRYLMPSLDVKMQSLSYLSHTGVRSTITVEKTPEVMALLDKFRAGGPLRLSASALKTFKACPMKFYLSYVRNMRGSDDLVDYLSAAQFGTVVHNTIQALYEPYKGRNINADIINRWLDESNDAVERTARRMIVQERYPGVADPDALQLSVDADIACRLVSAISRANLRAERDFYCADGESFIFYDNEYKVAKPWHIADGLDVNFYMSVDRVDRMQSGVIRFVDFKTGGDETNSQALDTLFTSRGKDGILQLFIYAMAYRDIVDGDADVMPVLHPMRRFSAGESLEPIRIGKNVVERFSEYEADFRPLFSAFVKKIFDPEVPFTQCTDTSGCKYCQFKTLCGRFEKS